MTFSIVARDPRTGAFGAATATAGPAVGALVIHGAARVGAIATQAMTNPLYGIHGIARLREGFSATETLAMLLREDPEAPRRQVMIVDRSGSVAHWSGPLCGVYADSLSVNDGAVGGNLLLNAETLAEMRREYQMGSELPFAERLLAAMRAGAAAGGDRRGMHSAALKIWYDREYPDVDARADWSAAPLDTLQEVLHQLRQPLFAGFFAEIPKGDPQ